MGEAEGGFTPLSQLKPSPEHRHRVRVRISRIWESFNPNDGTVFGLDSLLIDDEGGTMQAHVHRKVKKRVEERLIEGKVYTLSDFEVCSSKGNYMACRNPFMMNIGAQTVIDEIDGDVNVIPLHHFDFVDFGDVPPSMGLNNSSLTDVIGQVVEVWPIQQVPKKLCALQFCSLWIEDFSGKELDVTLDVCFPLQGKRIHGSLFISFKVLPRFGNTRSTTIPHELTSSKKSHSHRLIVHPHSQQASSVDPTHESQSISQRAQELQSSWRIIKQLQSLDPFELPKDAKFVCTATLKEIDCTQGWYYLGCVHCRHSIGRDGSEFWCSQCDPANKKRRRPYVWYKLNAVVMDDTGTMNLMTFAEEAEGLIGVAAELLKEIADDGR
uniref:Replication factor A C-terminal domain-containing protein n=1 Tax=Hordeum vulgare subsp. vulgare TaxID=112509 RepID=A0A8I6WWF6_HORVV